MFWEFEIELFSKELIKLFNSLIKVWLFIKFEDSDSDELMIFELKKDFILMIRNIKRMITKINIVIQKGLKIYLLIKE